ncbi:hypothetical protein OG696_40495 [Streptomyces sp. NBC_00656]|uniref:hypothetical protein n=1 Tax=Streptomyces sp. NBC_00656 TaxID=2903668 RepID=UPI003243EA88
MTRTTTLAGILLAGATLLATAGAATADELPLPGSAAVADNGGFADDGSNTSTTVISGNAPGGAGANFSDLW